jgi:hypothetical protein
VLVGFSKIRVSSSTFCHHRLDIWQNYWCRDGSIADEVGAAAPPFETDFMLLSSDFSPKYCIFIVTAPPFCLTAPTFKNYWIRHCIGVSRCYHLLLMTVFLFIIFMFDLIIFIFLETQSPIFGQIYILRKSVEQVL